MKLFTISHRKEGQSVNPDAIFQIGKYQVVNGGWTIHATYISPFVKPRYVMDLSTCVYRNDSFRKFRLFLLYKSGFNGAFHFINSHGFIPV